MLSSNFKVLNEWNTGKLRYYTQIPVDENTSNMLSSEIVTTLAEEFDLDALDEDIKVLVDGMSFLTKLELCANTSI